MAKKDDEKDKEKQHVDSKGSVSPEDEELTLWIHHLWARNESVERIEVWQVFGKEKRDRGEMIFHENFRQEDKRDIEQANKLANEIYAVAQNDCDATPKRREAYFQIAVIDTKRRAQPLVRRLGPLWPKRAQHAIARADATSDIDEEEELSLRSLELQRLKESANEARFDKKRNDYVLGEMLNLMRELLNEERSRTERLMGQVDGLFQRNMDAEDRKVQRDLLLEREKFKISLMREGVRSARNLLPGLFGPKGEASTAAHQEEQQTDGTLVQPKMYGASPERALVDNFLSDCEESELNVKLFGNYEEKDGKIACTQPGIFSVKQFSVLVGVSQGHLPPEALDALMPQSGSELTITEEQITQAIGAGVTEGIGMALMELMALRNRAKEAQETKTAPPTDSEVSP